jgi:hypothetical protein
VLLKVWGVTEEWFVLCFIILLSHLKLKNTKQIILLSHLKLKNTKQIILLSHLKLKNTKQIILLSHLKLKNTKQIILLHNKTTNFQQITLKSIHVQLWFFYFYFCYCFCAFKSLRCDRRMICFVFLSLTWCTSEYILRSQS